jgi:hypothetical protein
MRRIQFSPNSLYNIFPIFNSRSFALNISRYDCLQNFYTDIIKHPFQFDGLMDDMFLFIRQPFFSGKTCDTFTCLENKKWGLLDASQF